MDIGGGLRYFRVLRGFSSQEALGEACGLKKEYISRIETGAYPNPTPKTLKKVLDKLNIKLSVFFAHIGE